MASPDPTASEFRLVLLKVSDSLTEENVKKLAFLCENIAPAKRDKLSTGLDLFSELQGHDLLGERRVDLLTKWLDDLNLTSASEQLKQYKRTHLEADAISRGACLIHKDLPLKFVCVSCDLRICPECAFKTHGGGTSCDVIALDNLREEIDKRRESLGKVLDATATSTQSMGRLWQQTKDTSRKCRDTVRQTALKDYVSIREKAEKDKGTLLEKLASEELVELGQQLERGKEIEGIKFDLKELRKSQKSASEYSLGELQRINKDLKDIGDLAARVQRQQDAVQKKSNEIIHPEKKVIASVIFGEDRAVRVYDARGVNGSVMFECDNIRMDGTAWKLSVKVADKLSPVIVSHVDMWAHAHGGAHGLFAVGNTVFKVMPNSSAVTYVEIEDVPTGSWISSLTALNLSGTPSNVVMLSFHGSKVIKTYTFSSSGEPLDRIDLSEIDALGEISCLAYIYAMAAVIGRGCEEVLLVSTSGTKKVCASLRAPVAGLSPVTVLPVGNCWMVLFNGGEYGQRWKVVIYSMKGERSEDLRSWSSSSDLDIPIGIGRWKAMGYIVFNNSKMSLIKFKLPTSVRGSSVNTSKVVWESWK